EILSNAAYQERVEQIEAGMRSGLERSPGTERRGVYVQQCVSPHREIRKLRFDVSGGLERVIWIKESIHDLADRVPHPVLHFQRHQIGRRLPRLQPFRDPGLLEDILA